jgi:small GTP-binding protein
MADEVFPKYKVVLVGDTTVGKTSLIHSFLKQDVNPVSTLGATSTRIEVPLDQGTVILNVWDTAGQESLRNLVPVYAKGSQAAIIVFDQTNPASYEHVSGWYDYIVEHVGPIIICLAGNKKDLPGVVDFNDVFSWASDHKVEVVRTSAKEGVNVETLFETVARELYRQAQHQQAQTVPAPATVEIEAEVPKAEQRPSKNGGGGCC